MDVPTTVTAALEDHDVSGAVCLEAGAGVGNMTAGLLATDASCIYSVTNDRSDARMVRDRIGLAESGRVAVLEADLCAIPIENDSIDIITAHGLCNVLTPASLATIVEEMTRVSAPNGLLIIDDYEPPPNTAGIRELFAVQNAVSELADGRSSLTFYPPSILRAVFSDAAWEFDQKRTLLNPVPWTENHITAHTEVALNAAAKLPDPLREILTTEVERRAKRIDEESVGTMYSLTMRLCE